MGSSLRVTPLSSDIGVLVEGLDASVQPTPAEADELRRLFARHHLVLLRDQVTDPEQQIRFASVFGTVVDEGYHGKLFGYVSNHRADSATPLVSHLPWHSDYGWTPRPDSGLSLYGDEISGSLAPTRFASNSRALKALPMELRARISELRGLMMVDLSEYGTAEPCAVTPTHDGSGTPVFPTDEYNFPRITHPLVYRHPATGEDLLFVQEWYSVLIEGMGYGESQELLSELFEVLYDPQFLYEHDWQQGDLLVWDNLTLQHGRPPLLKSETGVRTMRRVVLHPAYDEIMNFSAKMHDMAEIVANTRR